MDQVSATNSPYRDEKPTIAARLEMLHEELRDVRQAQCDVDALKNRESAILDEIKQLDELLRKDRAKHILPLLDLAYVAAPCKADWNEMIGDERTRFCKPCGKNVHNLSAMSFDDAETFLRELTGNACVRIYRRKDGTVMTNDCPVGVSHRRVKRIATAIAGAGMVAAGVATLQEQSAAFIDIDLFEQSHATGGELATPNIPTIRSTPPMLISGPTRLSNPQGFNDTMVAECMISAEGLVNECRMVSGTEFMHQAMLDLVRQQRYAPATRNGQPVAVTHRIYAALEAPSRPTGGVVAVPMGVAQAQSVAGMSTSRQSNASAASGKAHQ